MFGTIKSKGRPLRLAFLIRPHDKKALVNAIELNSTLWGGTYNPIIPVFGKTTKRWRPNAFKKTAEDITLGYIKAFDPDFIVADFDPPKYVKSLGKEILTSQQLRSTKKSLNNPPYGIGINELLAWIYYDHFRFVQKNPLETVIPEIPSRHNLFWASWLGKLPKKVLTELLKSGYKDAMNITTPSVKELEKILHSRVFFPRRIVQYGLETYSRGSSSRENILFYMDPSDFLDVVDFWNLRAVGRNVLPVPVTLKDSSFFKQLAKKFIESSKGTHRYNKAIQYRANVIPATSRTTKEMQKFIDSLELKADVDGTTPVLMYQSYPRIWDDWARKNDGVEPHDIYFEEEGESEISDTKSRLPLPLSKPEGIKYPLMGNPKIANEISFNVYGDLKKYAEVFPQTYGEKVARSLGGLARLGEWRIGRNGLVRLVKSFGSAYWKLPLAEDIFVSWLEDNGWKYTASTAGMLAIELNNQIEGWTYGFADKELLDLIEEMANSVDGEGRDKPVGYLKNKMKQITGNEDRLEKFLEMNLFMLGVNAKCPNCKRGSWYELNKLDNTLVCSKCSKSFKALESLSKSKWAYKTVGPLSVPNRADGAISVVFSVDFFSERRMSTVQTSPVYSFIAQKKVRKREIELEADFAFLWRESVWGETAEGVAFGEAKTFNEFEKADFSRMETIGKEFPGAVLIFSTLRTKLTDFELIELKKLTKKGNKLWKTGRPLNPVLILTGNELFSLHGPPYCWSKKDRKKYRDCEGILGLAKATQQKYLGIKGWDETWQEELEKKFKLKKRKVRATKWKSLK